MHRPQNRVLLTLLGLSLLGACTEGVRVGDGVLKPVDAGVTYDTARPDIGDPLGAAGDPCQDGAACRSGLCLPAASGGVCTVACTESCDPGYACLPAPTGDGKACWPLSAVACQPCRDDAACQVGGQSGNRCVSYGDAGSFCGLACSADAPCPSGFDCNAEGQCVAASGECACNAAGVLAEAATACANSNAFGTCPGERACRATGLTRCVGPEPAAETCDGRDEDCDGETDEETDGAECELTNEFGTCLGAIACEAGIPLCVGRVPSAEVCNGVDDDCDGETDEGQPDLDGDTVKDCVDDDIDGDGSLNPDDCAPRDAAVFPGQTEVCNGIDDDCDLAIDEGTGDAAGQQCGVYTCAGDPGCRTLCLQDGHCVPGYLCDFEDGDDDGNARECLPSVCGNGAVEIREACDDGVNDGSYGGCLPGCGALGPRCGDGVRQPAHEACDDGPALNGTPNHCNSTCSGITPPECGNAVQEAGEACDLGAENSNAPNAACRLDCSPRRCGDGVVDGGSEEACDAGSANGQTVCGCRSDCRFVAATVTCRAGAGACDTAETCNGAGACPADAFLSGVTCRPEAGVCDAAEVCSGASASCPADAKRPATTVCRPTLGGCDPAELCDGGTNACPADTVRPSGFECRPASGACDEAERCDGQKRACPADVFKTADTVCREAAGDCDVEEWCPGSAGACPADGVASAATVCREAAGGCDLAERCSGSTKACPADALKPAASVCNPADGPCDVAETCDGASAACPEDALAPSGTVCHPSIGSCDPAEACDGESAACPEDFVAPDYTPCAVGQGSCTVEPCYCLSAECEQLCGNGVVDGPPTDGGGDEETPRAPKLFAPMGEVCDDGAMNGARDGCSLTCDGRCDADFGWVVDAGGPNTDGGHAIAVDEAGLSVAVGQFQASGDFWTAPSLPGGAPSFVPPWSAIFGDKAWYSDGWSSDFWVMAQDTDSGWKWSSCGGGPGEDVAHGVDTDDAGRVYVAGRFGERAAFGCCDDGTTVAGGTLLPEQGECPHTLDAVGGSSDYQDVFVASWGADGQVAWAVAAGSGSEDSAEDLATDSAGRSVVVGYHGGADWSPARFGSLSLGGQGYRDIFVARYDRNGNPVWVKGGGASGEDVAQGVALDGQGRAYVTGFFSGSFGWDDNATWVEHSMDAGGGGSDSGGRDLFLLGLDSDGGDPWVLTATAPNGDIEGLDVAVDGQGHAYVTGYFEGDSARFGDITVTTEGEWDADLFVAKASRAGWEWVAVASDAGADYTGQEIGFGVAVDRAGEVFVAGEFNTHVQFGPFGFDSLCGWSCIPQAPSLPQSAASFYGGDGFVAKLSAAGEWLWAKPFGGGGPTSARDLGLDPKGRIYLTGGFQAPGQFDEIVNDGYDDNSSIPMAPMFYGDEDAFVAKMVPDGGPRCFDCGDGVTDPGETCDDDDGLDHCGGACDGICFGPANGCGDGWDECEEGYDLGPDVDQPDLGMCMVPSGNLWCFQTAANAFTYDPVEPGVAVELGDGLKEEVPLEGMGGNPLQHPDCPACNPTDPSVDCRAGSARQWGGDGPPLTAGSSARSVCDGDPATPPCSTSVLGCSATATNDEDAAVECADYYEFVANTGAQVAFEFDELTRTQGPTAWSLWVSLTGAEGTFERVTGGPTTALTTPDFGSGLASPMHVVVLTEFVTAAGPVADQLDVHFRLYAWGATSTDQAWTVDNVRVGEPTVSPDLSGLVSHWPGDYSAVDAIDGNDGEWPEGGEAYSSAGARCGAFSFEGNAARHLYIGDPENLRLGQVSVGAWFRREAATSAGDALESLVSKWDNVSGGRAEYSLVIRGGKVAFAVSTVGDAATYREVTGGPAVTNGVWIHAVGTYDGERLSLYLDGVQVATLPFAGGPVQPSGATLEIGAIEEGATRAGFNGEIDEVMVFGRALRPTDVSSLYVGLLAEVDCPVAPADPPATVVWCFEDAAGTFITSTTKDENVYAPSSFAFGAGVTNPTSVTGSTTANRPPECTASTSKAATGTGWPTAATRSETTYFGVTINAPAGTYTFGFEAYRSGTGPRTYQLASPTLGTLGAWDIPDTSAWALFTWTGTLPGGPVEFRMYGYASEATSGTMRIDGVFLRPVND